MLISSSLKNEEVMSSIILILYNALNFENKQILYKTFLAAIDLQNKKSST